MYFLETRRKKPVPVGDLGITVSPEEGMWVSNNDYVGSICLQRLIELGHIRASHGEVSRMSKKLKRPKARMAEHSRPRTGKDLKDRRNRKPSPPPAPPKPSPDTITRAEARQIASQAAREAVEAVLSLLPPRSPAGDPELEERLERVVNKALDARPQVVHVSEGQALPAGVRRAQPDEPVYIPTGIVSKDANPDLKINTETSEGGSLGEAAAALKKLRKKEKNS
jgi:hypothetical protein